MKHTHGGYRPGSGRKKKNRIITTVSLHPTIKEEVFSCIKELNAKADESEGRQ